MLIIFYFIVFVFLPRVNINGYLTNQFKAIDINKYELSS